PVRTVPLQNQNVPSNNANNPPVRSVTQPQNVNLCDRDNTEYEPEEEDAFVLPLSRHQPRRDPSVVDKLDPYNVAEDILSMQASATIGQLLQYPNQRRNLAQVLKRPMVVEIEPDMETNVVQPTNKEHTTAAAATLMSRKMIEKSSLKIDEPSTTVAVTA
ncbi:16761_t:CDS:2, partial [Gigaspora margarita]